MTACAVLSALLFYLAAPNVFSDYGLWPAGWLFAVPLFFALEEKTARERALLGAFFGVCAFSLSVGWIWKISAAGGTIFVLSLSLPYIAFAFFYGRRAGRPGLLFVPALWVACEYLRNTLTGGFTWSIGYLQAFNLPVIQLADTTGVYGVTFMMVAINYSTYRFLNRKKWDTPRNCLCSKELRINCELVLILLVIAVIFGYDYIAARRPAPDTKPLRVAVIQGNIDQHKKWDNNFAGEIMERYMALTEEAARRRPDLIVWPETSFPADYYGDELMRARLGRLARSAKAAILVGTAVSEGGDFYNSAVLIGADGRLKGEYRKLHLVPFAETESFTAGRAPGALSPDGDDYFGVLICSEDFYPALARKLVDSKSRFMINLTNDAPLGKGSAPYIHAQGSIMRGVENRVPVVRCANSGYSHFVTARGEIAHPVEKAGERIFVDGYAVSDIIPAAPGRTVYNRIGDTFALCCFIFSLIWLIWGLAPGKMGHPS